MCMERFGGPGLFFLSPHRISGLACSSSLTSPTQDNRAEEALAPASAPHHPPAPGSVEPRQHGSTWLTSAEHCCWISLWHFLAYCPLKGTGSPTNGEMLVSWISCSSTSSHWILQGMLKYYQNKLSINVLVDSWAYDSFTRTVLWGNVTLTACTLPLPLGCHYLNPLL